MRDYKNIRAYQLADKLAQKIYQATKQFPKEELYGLTSQLRRAAVSVPTNIVEGASRQHKRDYQNFLYVARGSLAEGEYLLHLSNLLGYLDNASYADIERLRQETARTLFGLIHSVEAETKIPLHVVPPLVCLWSLVYGLLSLVFYS